ncbi:MAG: uroporphyrinogen decarboxylase/cobalamine-independent methonine synthase family protein [Candidatus Geothermincolia bacterium]
MELEGFVMSAIGSFPHADPELACELILGQIDDMPVWPQLPRRGFAESMYAQYSEGLPGAVVDLERLKVWCRSGEEVLPALEELYTAHLEGSLETFAISEDYAAGLHAFLRQVERRGGVPLAKGQVTGPISFGLTVGDQNNRPILYDETLADAMVKVLAGKAAWMERAMERAGVARVVTFFDEPYLVSIGSALVAVSPEQVVGMLNACADAVKGPAGVHCCGNTDWSILARTRMDLLSFDAYNYVDNLALYPSEIAAWLERGGRLAWGIIPNNEAYRDETAASLADRWNAGVELLAGRGVPRELLTQGCLITPSCGLEGVSEQECAEILKLTSDTTALLRERHG